MIWVFQSGGFDITLIQTIVINGFPLNIVELQAQYSMVLLWLHYSWMLKAYGTTTHILITQTGICNLLHQLVNMPVGGDP